MFMQIINRFRRDPLPSVGAMLLAAVLVASLCGLYVSNLTEQARYEEILRTVPVRLVVTNLTGTYSDNLQAPSFVVEAFTDPYTRNNLIEYITDVHIKATQDSDNCIVYWNGASLGMVVDKVFVGVTDAKFAGEAAPGTLFTWFDGYDETVFSRRALYCVIPESLVPEDYTPGDSLQVYGSFTYEIFDNGHSAYNTYGTYFTVVGTHSGSETLIYCPYQAVSIVYTMLGKGQEISAIEATLIDNDLIDEVREVANHWFAVPNATGARTRWDYSFYFYYPFALDIDNDELVNAERSLRICVMINEICAVLVFILSAGASFFVGFLIIRSRKREIALMRTLGTSPTSVFLHYTAEQMLCVLAGTAIGGWLFGFHPPERLAIFLAVYLLGLCLALGIFLSKNLMHSIKEDE